MQIKSAVISFLFSLSFCSCITVKNPVYRIEQSVMEDSSIRIVQISDFHSNDFGQNEEKLISNIKAACPDLIFLTGDIFDFRMGEKAVKNVELLLEGIKNLCPFFYICGNHEYYEGHTNEYAYLIEDYGGTILEDESVTVTVKNLKIVITGVSDPIIDVPVAKREKSAADSEKYALRVTEASRKAGTITGDLHILLAHRPEYIKLYTQENVYDLIFSGHAHGGQWRFPPLINGLYAPGQGIFPKYAGGRYDFTLENGRNEVFIVSRGLCHQTPSFPRIFNPLEVVIVDLIPSAAVSE